MKEIMVAAFLVLAVATPGLAQSYSAGWGTGNVIDVPLLEKTNGAYGYAMSVPPPGYAMSVPPQGGAAAFAHAGRHMKHHKRR
jgi:hypothetical protein